MVREVGQPARRHAGMGAREWNTTTVTGGASFGKYPLPAPYPSQGTLATQGGKES